MQSELCLTKPSQKRISMVLVAFMLASLMFMTGGAARVTPAQSFRTDKAFNGGRAQTDFTQRADQPLDDVANLVVVQADGKIVVAGTSFAYISGYANETTRQITLARYNPDGSLDLTF